MRRARSRSCPQWAPCPSGAPPSISAGGRASASREPCLLCPPHEATGPSDESDHSHPGVRTCREDARGSARNLIATRSLTPAIPHSRKALPSVLQPSSLHGHSSADFYEQRTGSLLGQQWETRGPCSSPRAPRPGGEEPFVRGHRPLQRRAVRDRSSQGPLRSRDSGPGSTWQDSLEEENTGVIQVTEVKDSDKGERSRRRADSEAPVTGTCSPRLRN